MQMSTEEIIDEIIQEIETQLDHDKLNQSSFHVFLLDLITKVMNVVEILKHDESGDTKKYIVIKVGEIVIQKHFPKYMDYYKENVGIIIELMIQSFYMLKDSKVTDTITECCLPCLKKKK